MSLQICFCLFGVRAGGENASWHCLHCACTVALSDRDRWCLCVCLRIVYKRWAQRKEAIGLFSQEDFCYSGLWGPGTKVWHWIGQSDSPLSVAWGMVLSQAWGCTVETDIGDSTEAPSAVAIVRFLNSYEIRSPRRDRAGEVGNEQSRSHVVTEDTNLWCIWRTSGLTCSGRPLKFNSQAEPL